MQTSAVANLYSIVSNLIQRDKTSLQKSGLTFQYDLDRDIHISAPLNGRDSLIAVLKPLEMTVSIGKFNSRSIAKKWNDCFRLYGWAIVPEGSYVFIPCKFGYARTPMGGLKSGLVWTVNYDIFPNFTIANEVKGSELIPWAEANIGAYGWVIHNNPKHTEQKPSHVVKRGDKIIICWGNWTDDDKTYALYHDLN